MDKFVRNLFIAIIILVLTCSGCGKSDEEKQKKDSETGTGQQKTSQVDFVDEIVKAENLLKEGKFHEAKTSLMKTISKDPYNIWVQKARELMMFAETSITIEEAIKKARDLLDKNELEAADGYVNSAFRMTSQIVQFTYLKDWNADLLKLSNEISQRRLSGIVGQPKDTTTSHKEKQETWQLDTDVEELYTSSNPNEFSFLTSDKEILFIANPSTKTIINKIELRDKACWTHLKSNFLFFVSERNSNLYAINIRTGEKTAIISNEAKVISVGISHYENDPFIYIGATKDNKEFLIQYNFRNNSVVSEQELETNRFMFLSKFQNDEIIVSSSGNLVLLPNQWVLFKTKPQLTLIRKFNPGECSVQGAISLPVNDWILDRGLSIKSFLEPSTSISRTYSNRFSAYIGQKLFDVNSQLIYIVTLIQESLNYKLQIFDLETSEEFISGTSLPQRHIQPIFTLTKDFVIYGIKNTRDVYLIKIPENFAKKNPAMVRESIYIEGRAGDSIQKSLIVSNLPPDAKFSATNLPEGWTIDEKTGTISGTIPPASSTSWGESKKFNFKISLKTAENKEYKIDGIIISKQELDKISFGNLIKSPREHGPFSGWTYWESPAYFPCGALESTATIVFRTTSSEADTLIFADFETNKCYALDLKSTIYSLVILKDEVWVSLSESYKIAIVDGKKREVTKYISVSEGKPQRITKTGNKIYVACGENKVAVYDAVKKVQVQTIVLQQMYDYSGVVVSSDENYLYAQGSPGSSPSATPSVYKKEGKGYKMIHYIHESSDPIVFDELYNRVFAGKTVYNKDLSQVISNVELNGVIIFYNLGVVAGRASVMYKAYKEGNINLYCLQDLNKIDTIKVCNEDIIGLTGREDNLYIVTKNNEVLCANLKQILHATQKEIPTLTLSKEKISQAEELVKSGKNLMETKNYNEAIKKFKEAQEIDPLCSAIIYEGIILSLQGEYDKALQKINDGVRKPLREPEMYSIAYHQMGLIHKKQKNCEYALECFKKAVEKDPKNKIFIRDLAEAYLLNDDLENGYFHYYKSAKLNDNVSKEKLKSLRTDFREKTLKECKYCNGKGKFETSFVEQDKVVKMMNKCDICDGTGKSWYIPCGNCKGKGYSGYYDFCNECDGLGKLYFSSNRD